MRSHFVRRYKMRLLSKLGRVNARDPEDKLREQASLEGTRDLLDRVAEIRAAAPRGEGGLAHFGIDRAAERRIREQADAQPLAGRAFDATDGGQLATRHALLESGDAIGAEEPVRTEDQDLAARDVEDLRVALAFSIASTTVASTGWPFSA